MIWSSDAIDAVQGVEEDAPHVPDVDSGEDLEKKRKTLVEQLEDIKQKRQLRHVQLLKEGGDLDHDLEFQELKLQDEQLGAEIRQLKEQLKAIHKAQAAPMERNRPEGNAVNVSNDVFGMTGWQSRLLYMLANEVGEERYRELKRIARADHRHKVEGEYYKKEHIYNESYDFDRMMRDNRNRYGGENL
jgi:hypothetical protein